MLNRFLANSWKLIRFLIALAFIAALLMLMNRLPSLVQKHGLKKYSSFDLAKKELNLKNTRLPAYIPEHLRFAWPPSEVYAQDAPFEASIMHFSFVAKKEIGLVVRQVDAKAPYTFDPVMRIKRTKEPVSIFVRDRKAVLFSALCDQDIPCNQIEWPEGNMNITLTGKCPAQDLIRIAASMLPAD